MSESIEQEDSFSIIANKQKAVVQKYKLLKYTISFQWTKIDLVLTELNKAMHLMSAGTSWIADERTNRTNETQSFEINESAPEFVNEYLELNDDLLRREVDIAKSLTEHAKKQHDAFEVAIEITNRKLDQCLKEFQDLFTSQNGGFSEIQKLSEQYKQYYAAKKRADELKCKLSSSRSPSSQSDSIDSVEFINKVKPMGKRSLSAIMTCDHADNDSSEAITNCPNQNLKRQANKLPRLMPSSDEDDNSDFKSADEADDNESVSTIFYFG